VIAWGRLVLGTALDATPFELPRPVPAEAGKNYHISGWHLSWGPS
jgi:hypothetical protein